MVGEDMKLTEQEKRIKLAEAARWKGISEQFLVGYAPWRTEPYSDRVNACPVDELECFPLDPSPDYFNDLNAVHELELKVFQDSSIQLDYSRSLIRIIKNSSPLGKQFFSDFDLVTANAAQRAEAIGLTLSLWE